MILGFSVAGFQLRWRKDSVNEVMYVQVHVCIYMYMYIHVYIHVYVCVTSVV